MRFALVEHNASLIVGTIHIIWKYGLNLPNASMNVNGIMLLHFV
jgi:hypothetical protein